MKAIKGYKLTTTPANASGTFTENEQTITFVYTPETIIIPDNGKDNGKDNGNGNGNEKGIIKNNGNVVTTSKIKTSAPKTGDSSGIRVMIYFTLMLAAAGAAMVTYIKRKRAL